MGVAQANRGNSNPTVTRSGGRLPAHDGRVDLSRESLKQLLTQGLSPEERLIVVLYYHEQLTLREIGLVLDLSEARVGQTHAAVLQRLRAQMDHLQRG